MALTACSDSEYGWRDDSKADELIGKRVNFNASMAREFKTRTTFNHDGSFNEGDQMRIFRQYSIGNGGARFDAATEAYRTYYLKMDYAAGTQVSLNSDWFPMTGKFKSDMPGSAPALQTEADSLVWENGRTVRFRAWGRSNLAGAIDAGTRSVYYPDYTVSDWVTVSGPTYNIPLVMRHITCRIGLACKPGNEFAGAVICTDWHDYKNTDNADTDAHDALETSKSDEQAREECNRVISVYNRMCMPAGVDDNTMLLTAMRQSLYNDENTDFRNLERYGTADGIVMAGTMSADDIESDVQHPVFNSCDGRLYMMSVPFDMSSTGLGHELVLPACTRFKVWLYEVNNGDRAATTGTEGTWHIFSLSDIVRENGDPAFPEGLDLKAGYSYLFTVGYHYDSLTVQVSDSFSWSEQDMGSDQAADEAHAREDLDYGWWSSAYRTAAKEALAGGDFIPTFSIGDQTEFVTFIRLVNGTAATRMSGLTRAETRKDGNGNEIKDADGFETYWWIVDGQVDEHGNPLKVTRQEAESMGYVFYPHFYPTVSTQAAHVTEDYVTGPMDFFDTDFGTRYEVNLTHDLDMYDWELPGIGERVDKPFRGNFKGNGHMLVNLNMQSGYLFDHVMDGAISNLRIMTTHNTCLLNTATSNEFEGWGCYITGVSMMCNSTGNSIARSLTGRSYVVGCIHVGKAGGALVGESDDLTMLGCMQAAWGLPSGTGALLGTYAAGAQSDFFEPQAAKNMTWGNFMCNFYDTEKSPGTNAVADIADSYTPQQYIRGRKSHILKAKNDYLLGVDANYNALSANMKNEIYGLAPWKAMNYAIYKYNTSEQGTAYPCNMHFESSSVGYGHLYPVLTPGVPVIEESWNPLSQNN